MGEEAQVRIVILTVVSFFLGVAATACWFYFAPIRSAENLVPQPTGQQNNPQVPQPVTAANPPAQKFVESPVPVSAAAVEDVKRALPNYASLSVEQGTEILRESALKKYADAAAELQSQVTRAQEELKAAQNKSPANQQAALKHLQQVQAEQSQKLQQIGGELQTQITALKQLKGGQ